MLIGILFLIRGLERLVIALLCMHLLMTALPLVLLPQITWHAFLVPTLAGQYIIKNILLPFVIITFSITILVWITQVLKLLYLIDKGVDPIHFLRTIVLILPSLLFVLLPIDCFPPLELEPPGRIYRLALVAHFKV